MVGEKEYIKWILLYTLLEVQDMSDMNDLYNAQDMILFCEIIENICFKSQITTPKIVTYPVNSTAVLIGSSPKYF